MTNEELQQIRERAEKATAGPWEYDGSDIMAPPFLDIVDHVYETADADFIAHAREDIPALMAEVERLRTIIDETQEYIVLHAFDTTVGRKIDDFITERLKAQNSEHTS